VSLPESSGLRPPAAGGRQSDDEERTATVLHILVASGPAGPVLVLSGEADIGSVPALRGALDAQLTGGTRQLSVDLSGLGFADSSAIRELLVAATALREHDGDLVLLNPQPGVARVLELMSVDHLVTIRPPGLSPAQCTR
jgi:anti-sigma B factor antagonist